MNNEQSHEESEQVIKFVSEDYEDKDISLSFPWYQEKTMKIADPLLRMHNELIDFCLLVSAQGEKRERRRAQEVLKEIRIAVEAIHSDSIVCAPFLKNGVYLKQTEIEVFILIPDLSEQKAAKITLWIAQFSRGNLSQIESKQKYLLFEYQISPPNSPPFTIRLLDHKIWHEFFALIEESFQTNIELKYLYILVSYMVRSRWMHMGLRSYFIFGLLSAFYYQRRKQRQRMLSQSVIKFLEYFGVGPFQERRMVYVGKNRYEFAMDQGIFSFWVGGINMANPSVKDLFNVLRNRYRLIANYNFDEGMSIIGALVNPTGKDFWL